jgi:ADP-ribosylglycohydrolase
MKDTPLFIKDYAGTACSIYHALPVIIHIMYHTQSFEEAIRKNTAIGGASSDRGMLLGALLSFYYDIPETFKTLSEKSLRNID